MTPDNQATPTGESYSDTIFEKILNEPIGSAARGLRILEFYRHAKSLESTLSGAQKEIARLNEQAAGYAIERKDLETAVTRLTRENGELRGRAEQLSALMDGLEIENQDSLVNEPANVFKAIGQEISKAAKHGANLYSLQCKATPVTRLTRENGELRERLK